MRALLALALVAVSLNAVHAQAPVAGDWSGELAGTGLTLVVHVTETGGSFASTFDVPLQGARGVPVGTTTFAGGVLTLEIPSIGGRYEGTLAGDEVLGTWSQSGASLPLTLRRLTAGDLAGPLERADTPRAPFPYRDEEVTVSSVDGVTLAATLTIPDGDGPFPAVVLVSGSGPQNRDEEILGHRPFRVLADHLARRGIAVLRYDDRGVAGSTGDFGSATTADFALDAQSAAEYLDARPEVTSVGIVGHSEGGIIAPVAARATRAVDFAVLLAGPGVSGREVLAYQLARDVDASAASPDAVAAYRRALAALLDELPRGDAATAASRAAAAYRREMAGVRPDDLAALGETSADELAGGLAGPWERYFVGYDPAPALRALHVPVLAVFAARDQQVRAQDNVPAAVAALAGAPAGSSVVVLPGLNHLFQPTETGSPVEYGTLQTSFDPAMMELVADWILRRNP